MGKDLRLTTRVTSQEFDEVKKRASDLGVTLSGYVARVIRRELEAQRLADEAYAFRVYQERLSDAPQMVCGGDR